MPGWIDTHDHIVWHFNKEDRADTSKETPTEFAGDLMSDFNSRRGRIAGMDVKGATQSIRAQVPMSEMLNYAPALRSMTQGRSSFQMEFSHYEEVPRPVQEKIIAEAQKRMQAEHAG